MGRHAKPGEAAACGCGAMPAEPRADQHSKQQQQVLHHPVVGDGRQATQVLRVEQASLRQRAQARADMRTCRWGRVGKVAGQASFPCATLEQAMKTFCTMFRDKTKNDWWLGRGGGAALHRN